MKLRLFFYAFLPMLQFVSLTHGHSWIDALWCECPRNIGFPRNYLSGDVLKKRKQKLDVVMTHRMKRTSVDLCSKLQSKPGQHSNFPHLRCPPGSIVHFSYRPNGHVSVDKCLRTDPRGCDPKINPLTGQRYPAPTYWSIHWSELAVGKGGNSQMSKRADVNKISNKILFSKNGRPKYIRNKYLKISSFDDGKCGEKNKYNIHRVNRNKGCHGSFQIPTQGIKIGSLYKFVWYWIFDRNFKVGEEYTTCFDVKIVNENEIDCSPKGKAKPPRTTQSSVKKKQRQCSLSEGDALNHVHAVYDESCSRIGKVGCYFTGKQWCRLCRRKYDKKMHTNNHLGFCS